MMVYIIAGACLLIVFWLLELVLRIPKVPNLSSKYVLITGCDSGFGNQLAIQLDGKGIHVIAACLTKKASKELNMLLSSRSSTIVMDVTDNSSVQQAMHCVQEIIPESKGLWGLVNNAGVFGCLGAMDWWSREEYKKVLDVNLFGLIDVTKVFTPLLKQGKGRIVNVASVLGRIVVPEAGYCISKFGVECFSDEIRVLLKAFGISVSIIEPGFFKTAICHQENLLPKLKERWKDLSPEIREEYGGEDFMKEKINSTKDFLIEAPSTRTDKVVNAMEHALTAKYPKKRYSVGYDAKLLWIPLSYMPAFITDALVGRESY